MSVGEERNGCGPWGDLGDGGRWYKLFVCLGGLSKKKTDAEPSMTCSNIMILVVAP